LIMVRREDSWRYQLNRGRRLANPRVQSPLHVSEYTAGFADA